MSNQTFEKTRHDLYWFLRQLTMQVHDYQLYRKAVRLDIYFDTGAIRAALLGWMSFYRHNGTFDQDAFDNRQTLVQCLATAGWLGQVSLLPPHQSELLTQLNGGFRFPAIPAFSQSAGELLKSVGLGPDSDWNRGSLASLSDEELRDFVLRNAGSAEDFFKAVQSVRYGSWQQRLRKLREDDLLFLHPSDIDLESILASDHFRRARKAFDDLRPEISINNFTDAVAVALLIDKLQAYKRGDAESVPRFLVPSHKFSTVIDRADLYGDLEYEVEGIGKMSILRNVDYFIFRAIFFPKGRSAGQDVDEVGRAGTELKDLRTAIRDIAESQEPLTPSALRKIDGSGGGSLRDLINRLRSVSFFENVWLPTAAREDLAGLAKDITEAAQDARLREAAQWTLEDTKQKLRNNAMEFQRVGRLAVDCQEAASQFQRRTSSHLLHMVDFFKDFGLARYAIPEALRPRIQATASGLLSADADLQKEVLNDIVASAHLALKGRLEIGEAITLATILFLLHLDRHLIETFDRPEYSQHSFRLLLVACMCRAVRNPEGVSLAAENHTVDRRTPADRLRGLRQALLIKAQIIIARLEESYPEIKDEAEKYAVSLGLSYVYYRLWDAAGNRPSWRAGLGLPLTVPDAMLDRSGGRRWADLALFYGREAMAYGRSNPSRFSFAATHHMFYLVECGTDEDLGEMAQMASVLAQCKVDGEGWQYRGDEALAHYFHRLALRSSNSDHQPPKVDKELLAQAMDRIKDALRASVDDEEVKAYATMLDVAYVV